MLYAVQMLSRRNLFRHYLIEKTQERGKLIFSQEFKCFSVFLLGKRITMYEKEVPGKACLFV